MRGIGAADGQSQVPWRQWSCWSAPVWLRIYSCSTARPRLLGRHRPPPASTSPAPLAPFAGQVVLPFTDLSGPSAVAVDDAGAVYVVHGTGNLFPPHRGGRVLKLDPGADQAIALPFTDLHPDWLTVDAAGSLYFSDSSASGVLKLVAGSSTPEKVLADLDVPRGVAVDGAGNLYVAGGGLNSRVLKQAAGSSSPVELPFTGLRNPTGVAVDGSGTVYVADGGNNRVLKLSTSGMIELPIADLKNPQGVALDSAGSLYVVDGGNNRVLKLAAGAPAATALPFIGLDRPAGVAVDPAGNVYVTDAGNNRVLKLPAK